MSKKNEYLWIVADPHGVSVALRKDTYELHIQDTDKRGEKSVDHLVEVADNVPRVIQNPRFIYHDRDHDENSRIRYADLMHVPSSDAIRALVVVVEDDRRPREVVTWTIKRSLAQENATKEAIIYDSRQSDKKQREV
jgi:hypothetical protein